MALSLYPSLLPVCLKGRLFFDAVAQGVYVCLCGERFFFFQAIKQDFMIFLLKKNGKKIACARCLFSCCYCVASGTLSFWWRVNADVLLCHVFFFSFFFSTLADSCIFFLCLSLVFLSLYTHAWAVLWSIHLSTNVRITHLSLLMLLLFFFLPLFPT